ncbi:ecdysone 20-monooxygenase-like [Oppia nitens]|uniref:ecdysone 20-monooxygenase-like n=1 Tax=Oppia nitens TaxID=1686743 RepID=UPI0023DB48CB|nr:ecdysone 20-monooxygenase-like [Oppia nitens]
MKTVNQIPGPRPSLPIIGTGWQYWPLVRRYNIRQLPKILAENFRKYGPIYREEHRKSKPIVYICDPIDIETVFRFQGKCPVRPPNDFVINYRSENSHRYGSVGITNMNGIEWYKTRQLLAPVLMSTDMFNNYIPKLVDICEDFRDYFDRQLVEVVVVVDQQKTTTDPDVKQCMDFSEITYKFVLESMSTWCLDRRLGCLDSSTTTTTGDGSSGSCRPDIDTDGRLMIEATRELFASYQKLFYGSLRLWRYLKTRPYRQLASSESRIYETLSKYVDTAIAGAVNSNTDSTDSLVSEKNSRCLMTELIQLNQLSTSEIKVTLMDLIIGGLFTVSNSLNFICHHLAGNPRVQQKLFAEITDVFNISSNTSNSDIITSDLLTKMPYLKACIKESFRLTPPVPGILRVLPVDVQLSGYTVPKDTLIFVNTMTTCLSDKYFHKPDSYIPERWLAADSNDDDSGGQHQPKCPAFSVLPFGFGSRQCIGKRFAQLNIQLAIVTLIRHYELLAINDDNNTDGKDKLELICDFLIIPDKNIRFKVKKRKV